jgi:CheY-like chemotaxis protein
VIVAITANAFRDDIEKAEAVGMNSHLAKPVDQEKLVGALVKYL